MALDPPSHIGAHLPVDRGIGRRSVLLMGGLGASGVLGARLTSDFAHAMPAAPPPPAPPGVGLPAPPPAPAANAPAREPLTSGALGPWRTSQHGTSHPDEDALATERDGVHLVGDSIATRLLPALRPRLQGRPLSYDVWNGRPTAPGLDELDKAARENRLPRTVLVVLGSNDIFDPWGFEGQVRRCLQIVGDRRVLWVTPYVARRQAPSADMRNSAVIGLVLERAASAGTIELVRWFEFLARVAPRLEDYIEDGVHPTQAGAAALADLVVTALARPR